MFRKELLDTLKTVAGILLFTVSALAFSHFLYGLATDDNVKFMDYFPLALWMALPFIVFYIGTGLYTAEKNGRTFEYFFSVPVSRWNALAYKIVPRVLAVMAFLAIYFILLAAMPPENRTFSHNMGFYLLMLLSIFLYSISTSLIHKRNSTGMILTLFILIVMLTTLLTIVGGLNLHNIKVTYDVLLVLSFLISTALFLGFIFRYKRYDMSNMERMNRKNLLQVLLPVGVLLLALIGINQVDTANPPNLYTIQKAPLEAYKNDNGFYRLWTLPEPPDVNVESDEVIEKYRRLFKAGRENENFMENWTHGTYRKMSASTIKSLTLAIGKTKVFHGSRWMSDPSQVEELEKKKLFATYLMERYQNAIDSEYFVDLTPPRWESPIFNHLAWLRVGAFYLAVNAVEAAKGQWETGVANIIRHFEFTRRVARATPVFITNLLSNALARYSLQTLVGLMNRDDCPQQVYSQILEAMPPSAVEDFQVVRCLKSEYVAFRQYIESDRYMDDELFPHSEISIFHRIGHHLFFQKNRTIGYLNQYTKEIIGHAKTPPYQWKADVPRSERATGSGWWFINSAGKVKTDLWFSGHSTALQKYYLLRSIYDITRITAELHLKDDPAKPVSAVLAELQTYKTTDPCSGAPYIFKPEKEIMYGIGTDRKDNGGKPFINDFSMVDFVLPVRLKRRGNIPK